MRLAGILLPFLSVLMSSCIPLASRHATKDFNSYVSADESYVFSDDSTFTWRGSGGVGKGTVKIIKDSIKLSFNEVTRTFEIQLNEKTPNSSINSHVEVRAIQANGQPFDGLVVELTQSNIITETDRFGIAKINVNDCLLNDVINIYFENSHLASFKIELRGYDHLIAIVVNDETKYRSNQTFTYHFKKKKGYIFLNGTRFSKYLPLS